MEQQLTREDTRTVWSVWAGRGAQVNVAMLDLYTEFPRLHRAGLIYPAGLETRRNGETLIEYQVTPAGEQIARAHDARPASGR